MSDDRVVQGITSVAQQIGELKTTLEASFPQQLGTATSATGGSGTLPANPVGFLVVTLTSGLAVKVPYYT